MFPPPFSGPRFSGYHAIMGRTDTKMYNDIVDYMRAYSQEKDTKTSEEDPVKGFYACSGEWVSYIKVHKDNDKEVDASIEALLNRDDYYFGRKDQGKPDYSGTIPEENLKPFGKRDTVLEEYLNAVFKIPEPKVY